MQKGRAKAKAKKRRVMFSLEAPNANEVMVAGDFNRWNVKTHPMKKDNSGVWKNALMVSPGRYDYKFLVDGRWKNDPKNDQTCPNCFGTLNNVLIVS
jgi:1,4-alpha-glucan branching enzyme